MTSIIDDCPTCSGDEHANTETCGTCNGTGHEPMSRQNEKPLYIS